MSCSTVSGGNDSVLSQAQNVSGDTWSKSHDRNAPPPSPTPPSQPNSLISDRLGPESERILDSFSFDCCPNWDLTATLGTLEGEKSMPLP